jgi:autotransporter-associated beta strand protein
VAGVSGPLGFGNIISFNGGRLGHTANNTFDYSPRFNTAAGQQYKIDTGGFNVTYSNNLASSGATLLKIGGGILTLAGSNSYSGLTTVSNGTLALVGPKTGTGNITVDDAGTLGIFEADARTNTPSTLTLGSSAGGGLEYDNMTNRAVAPLQASTIASSGSQLISINSGSFTTNTAGRTNPLVSWTSGSAPGTTLGVVDGGGGFLNTNGNRIEFITTSVALIWDGTNGASWNNANNWKDEGIPVNYADPKQVSLNDDAAGETNVTLTAAVAPEAVNINNNSLIYSITSSSGNKIGGAARFSKSGTADATLSGGFNDYTGITTLKGGTLNVNTLANGGSASDIGAAGNGATNLVFRGGTLRYVGAGSSSDHLFRLTTAGGSIVADGTGALNLSSPGSVLLNGVLTLGGTNENTNTVRISMIGVGSVVKNGSGRWILTGETNTYGGGTIVNAGILQVGASPSGSVGLGPVTLNNGTPLIFKRTGTVNVPGVISGNGYVDVIDTGTVILENNNTYSGPTTINAGTLQIGNGGSTGAINGGGGITNNATLVFASTGDATYQNTSTINGPGNVIAQAGRTRVIGANTYTGWTQINPGATFQPCQGNQGALVSSVVTNNGTLMLIRQDNGVFFYSNNVVGTGRVVKDANNNNDSDVTLLGTNTYSGGTVIGAGGLIIGDGVTAGAVPTLGTGFVFFTNGVTGNDIDRRIVWNIPGGTVTFGGTISGQGGIGFIGTATIANSGRVEQRGTNSLLTLSANNSHLGGATIVDATGRLRLGNGGLTGSSGSGPIANAGTLIFNRSGNSINGALTVGAISGAGSVQQTNSGIILATGNNTYAGDTVISNGTLALSGNLGGNVTVAGGNLAPGGLGTVGNLTNGGALNWSAGNVVVTLNKSLAQSNSFMSAGSISYTGGGLKLLNYGPTLTVGDRFVLFNSSITGGAGIPINSPGFIVQNDLGTDGSVTVTNVSASALAMTETHSGGTNQIITWPSAWNGYSLYSQTNGVLTNNPPQGGISGNWFKVVGSDLVNGYTNNNAFNKFNKSVFFRLQPY